MKKTSILILVLLAQLIFAQTYRFVYQVSMKPNANDKSSIKTENAYLDISGEKSFFYSENRIKRDSLMRANFQSGGARVFIRDQMESLRSEINYSIEKNKKEQKTIYKDRVGRDIYAYEEDRPLDWKISPETTKIGDYKVQKAETEFGGRKWTAWFTTDLPYQDGPYKFSGLPGLVVKAEDEAGDYSFDLVKNYKISDFPEMNQFGTVIKVKRADYSKQQEKFTKDPSSFINSQRSGGNTSIVIINSNGRQSNPADMRKRMEERAKEEAKNHNNPIELK